MKLTIDMELSDSDKKMLCATLGCNLTALNDTLTGHALAAIHEYVEAYLARRAFSKGSDILEYRLALLIQHAFGNKIPDDLTVSRLLQRTPASSRTVIRNTLSKYRYQLDAAEVESVKALLESADWAGGGSDICRVNASRNLVEVMNQRLRAEESTLKQVLHDAGSVGLYAIREHTYNKLCKLFGAKKVEKT